MKSENKARKKAATKSDNPVEAYLATLPTTHRAALERLRRTIRGFIPDAEECISYGLPAFRLDGKVVGGFAATAQGCSYYPFSGTTLATLQGELVGYSQTKSALHFGPDQPLPGSLVRRLLKARIAETKVRPARAPIKAKHGSKARSR